MLGSNLNPILTQLSRTKKVVYVEGHDFQVISKIAAKLGYSVVANRSKFAVVPTEGFNPLRAKNFTQGMQTALEDDIKVAVIFDRDYRSNEEVERELSELKTFCDYAHIHSMKELENFLLVPSAIERAIKKRILERNKRSGKDLVYVENVKEMLEELSDKMKHNVQSQYLNRQSKFCKQLDRSLDESTIMTEVLQQFDGKWGNFKQRMEIVPGKTLLSKLNIYLQEKYGITITANYIINAMVASEVPIEMEQIISALNQFGNTGVVDAGLFDLL